ncbi:MAG: hypothetical protein ACRDL6_11065 [Solirubrobacterales bacterium]
MAFAALLGAALVLLVAQLGIERANAAKTKIVSDTTTITAANDTPRKTVLCPRKKKRFKFPYGGAMFSTSAYDADGVGVYPHSYERLGVQHGYHVTPVYYDPAPDAASGPRQVTLQVVCGPEPGKINPPHLTAQVNPGDFKTHQVRCTGKRKLIGGGFQRTTFVGPIRGAPPSGDFATESHAIARNVWQVSGTAFGKFGGELTGIAYCRKKSNLSEVSATTTIIPGQFGSATTPSCPKKKKLVFTGFTTFPQGSIFYAGGPINRNQSTTGSGYNRSLAPAILTVFGYCLTVRPNL